MRPFLVRGTALIAAILFLSVALFEYRHRQQVQHAAALFAATTVEPLGDIGSTRSLRILPLMEFHGNRPELKTEVGISYLVQTDQHLILYDVGHNAGGESPSPLEHNMKLLGIELEDIDTVFISHNHLDHVGGLHWQRNDTFSLGVEQRPFPNPLTRLIAPATMSYPGMLADHANRPMPIGEGIGSTGLATTGTIGRKLPVGWIEEHSLVVMVEGLGGVIIVACGHQPLPNLLRRYDDLFEQPLYGIIGGLHFPVPEGRIHVGPLDVQRQLASGDSVFRPLDTPEVERQLAMLRERDLGIIAVSGHDSSDDIIDRVRRDFGDAHRYIRVGEEIIIGAGQRAAINPRQSHSPGHAGPR